MPLPPLPPPPGPGHYETQGSTDTERKLVTGAVFRSNTSRWTAPEKLSGPGPGKLATCTLGLVLPWKWSLNYVSSICTRVRVQVHVYICKAVGWNLASSQALPCARTQTTSTSARQNLGTRLVETMQWNASLYRALKYVVKPLLD